MPTATRPRRKKTPTRRSRSKRRITPEDLRQFCIVSDPRIAPDGEQIVFVHKQASPKRAGEYESNLWITDVDNGRPRQFSSGGRDRLPRWSPDGTRLVFVSGRDKPRQQIYVMEAAGGEARALTRFPEGSIGSVKWSPDGTCLAVSFREQSPQWTEESTKARKEAGASEPPRILDHWWYRLDGDGYFDGQRYHLYLVDAETGQHRSIYRKDTLGFFTFDFSPDGRELVVATNRHRRAGLGAWNDELLRLTVATGRVRPIPNLPAGPKDAVRWSPNGKWIAYAGRVGEDPTYSTENLELWVCDPRTGRARSLTARTDYCLMAICATDSAEMIFGPAFRWSPDSRRVYMQIGWQGESHVASARPGGGPIRMHTSGARIHALGTIDAKSKRMALTIGSPTKLDEIHVADLAGESMRPRAVTNFNGPLLRGLDLAKPASQWIRSPDGTRVQVWTMLPPGATPRRRLPAVLEIHGGPHAQYGAGFFLEFQVLAAAGYAVVYSNPRGSKGYGRDFCAAIRGRWGDADWTDIQAVTEFMKAHPALDSKRLGIMGGSYGGYMTNWAISQTHDFAAAITDRCVSNLLSMSGTSDFMDPPEMYWPGNWWSKPEARWEQSPLRHFGNVRTPTLVIHSEGDLRCNVEQAEQVFATLWIRGVPTRFVRYPRSTSHGLSRAGPPDLRIHRLHQILDWWRQYLR
ncbi:MAG: S9 family peptidase [Planctomycetota bacterium]|jgi:dipeptidyl aminopeptidase/acylaminoacyl peptidase